MTADLKLDDNHIYWLADKRVPGFSEICRDMGVTRENSFYTHQGREEGIALHKWLLFLAQGKESKAEIDPRIVGRVKGIKKFLAESNFRIVDGEKSLYAPVERFACTPDLWGFIGNWTWVIDAKRGGKLPTHRLQTAAQAIALKANGFMTQKRGGLYLRDEDYRLEEHLDRRDLINWRAIVAGYHAMTESERLIFASDEFTQFNPECLGMRHGPKWMLIVSAHNAKLMYQ